jgi:hypothetical protein
VNMTADGAGMKKLAVAAWFWTATTIASLPAPRRLSGINSNLESDRFLEDASYIRFRNLNIGYKFTMKAFTNLPVEDIRIYTNAKLIYME